jgi:predicted metallopeptidase
MVTKSKRRSFGYTTAIAKVCEDICFRVPALSHIDMSRVAVSFAQTKHSAPFGIFATTTPLRFKGGELFIQSQGKPWTLQRCYRPDGVEYLYILYFYVPRFIELKLSQKLETIVHELYHINPDFNGDLRRFKGRCFAHGSSQKKYDQTVRDFVNHWLKQNPPPKVWNFLQYNYKELIAEFGGLHGTRIPAPKIIAIEK